MSLHINKKVNVYIHIIDLEERNEAKYQNLCSTLDYSEIICANKYVSNLVRRKYIIRHGRLREIIGKHLGILPNEIVLGRNRYGKPNVVSPVTSIDFSLSKSGDLAVAAIGEDCSIGVDVEKVRPIQDKKRILHSCLSDREMRIAGPPTTSAFLTVWTLKEAVVKATGEGLSRGLRSFEFDSFSPPHLSRFDGLCVDGQWIVESFEPRADYVGAVAVMST